MQVEYLYKWRIQRGGQWTTTHHCSEDEVKSEHPEAIRLPGTLLERKIPDEAMASFAKDVPF